MFLGRRQGVAGRIQHVVSSEEVLDVDELEALLLLIELDALALLLEHSVLRLDVLELLRQFAFACDWQRPKSSAFLTYKKCVTSEAPYVKCALRPSAHPQSPCALRFPRPWA